MDFLNKTSTQISELFRSMSPRRTHHRRFAAGHRSRQPELPGNAPVEFARRLSVWGANTHQYGNRSCHGGVRQSESS